MKSKYLACLFCLGIVFFLVFTGCQGAQEKLGSLNIGSFKGSVMVKVSDSSAWRAVRSGEVIRTGYTIKCEANGSAGISLKDKELVKLAPSTQLKVKSFTTKGEKISIKLGLEKGDTFSTVEKGTMDYSIETPVAIMGVIGTAFRVTVQEKTGDTRVAVVVGEVAVTSSEATVNVKEKFALEIKKDEPLGQPQPIVLLKEMFDGRCVIDLAENITRERTRELDVREIDMEKLDSK